MNRKKDGEKRTKTKKYKISKKTQKIEQKQFEISWGYSQMSYERFHLLVRKIDFVLEQLRKLSITAKEENGKIVAIAKNKDEERYIKDYFSILEDLLNKSEEEIQEDFHISINSRIEKIERNLSWVIDDLKELKKDIDKIKVFFYKKYFIDF